MKSYHDSDIVLATLLIVKFINMVLKYKLLPKSYLWYFISIGGSSTPLSSYNSIGDIQVS